MEPNVLVIVGSPKGKKGNSDSIADSMIDSLNNYCISSTKIILRKEIDEPNTIMELLNRCDIVILSFPIYENSIPGLVLELFEIINSNKEKLDKKQRKMLVISNSGFPEPIANASAISHCKLFASKIGFLWMGGLPISPGTLIGGKRLEEVGNTYKKVLQLLNIIAKKISMDENITESEWSLISKPIISPFIYRIVGRIIQIGVIKKVGKEKYFAKPLI